MASTLSNGFVKPATGDKGPVVFPALEGNIQKVNDHTHNGTNSELLSSVNIQKGTLTVSSTSWNSDATSGIYKKTVTCPSTYLTTTSNMKVTFSGGTYDGDQCFPTIIKQSSNTFDIYSPVNNQAYIIYFT